MGGLFSIYEGVHKLQQPEPLSQVWIALVVLVLAIFLEGSSLFGALREIKKVREFCFNSITMPFGPDTMLAAKIKMASGLSIDEAVDSINVLERELKERVPKLKWCFIEPDVAD